MFKLLVIGVIIIGRDPFALFGMQAPGIWEWGQGNKVSFTRTVGVIKALTLCCLPSSGGTVCKRVVSGSQNDAVGLSLAVLLIRLCLHTLGSVYLHLWDFISSSRSTAGVIRYCFCLHLLSPGVCSCRRLRGRITANITFANKTLLLALFQQKPVAVKLDCSSGPQVKRKQDSLIGLSLCLAPASCVPLKLQQEHLFVISNSSFFASRHLKSNYLRKEIPSHQLI